MRKKLHFKKFYYILQPNILRNTLWRCKFKNIMAKTLRVINQFFSTEVGDIFEYDSSDGMYTTLRSEEFYNMTDDKPSSVRAMFDAEFKISKEYAKSLIEEGYLEEVTEEKTPFVNIFDEIDNLITKYQTGLDNLAEDAAELPTCVKVEREVVLTNLITLLKHLKSLKK